MAQEYWCKRESGVFGPASIEDCASRLEADDVISNSPEGPWSRLGDNPAYKILTGTYSDATKTHRLTDNVASVGKIETPTSQKKIKSTLRKNRMRRQMRLIWRLRNEPIADYTLFIFAFTVLAYAVYGIYYASSSMGEPNQPKSGFMWYFNTGSLFALGIVVSLFAFAIASPGSD